MTPGQVQGIFEQFKKALFERALGAEISHHLVYAAGQEQQQSGQKNAAPVGWEKGQQARERFGRALGRSG